MVIPNEHYENRNEGKIEEIEFQNLVKTSCVKNVVSMQLFQISVLRRFTIYIKYTLI